MGLFGRRSYRDRSLPPDWPPSRGTLASTAYAQTWGHWTTLANIAESRRFLETHMELLQPASEILLGLMIRKQQSEGQSTAVAWYRLDVLREIKAHGNTRAAIQEAYIDIHNGLDAVDLPSWLASTVSQVRGVTGAPEQRAQARVPLLRNAIQRAEQDRAVLPESVASLRQWLGDSLSESLVPDLVSAIQCWERALQTFTLQRYPRHYAALEHSLGAAYSQLAIAGNADRTRLGNASKCFEQALRVYDREGFPEEWADVQLQFGVVHATLGDKRQAKQCLQAAETYFTIDQDPEKWQIIQSALQSLDAPSPDLDADLLKPLLRMGVISDSGYRELRKKL